MRFANFEGSLGFSVPSIILVDLLGNTCLLFTCMSAKGHGLWFVIGGFWSVLFVWCFKVCCFVIACFRQNYWLVKFASQIFLIFFILGICKNKAMSASFFQQKIHPPSRFPLLFLSSLRVILSQAGQAHHIVICINPAFTKMLTEQKNPKSLRSFQ